MNATHDDAEKTTHSRRLRTSAPALRSRRGKRTRAQPAADSQLHSLEQRIECRFHDRALLERALTHSSWAAQGGAEGARDNELLEFLGDAVLALRTTERLLEVFPEEDEGRLSRLRSWIVSARNLSAAAQRLQLGLLLRLSKNEETLGGRNKERLLANALEALIGAVHLDQGYAAASQLIDHWVLVDDLERLSPEALHEFAYKSALQEWAHAQGKNPPSYRVVGASGPDHGKTFTVEVTLSGIYSGRASGPSKKSAEQKAAYGALVHLGQLQPMR